MYQCHCWLSENYPLSISVISCFLRLNKRQTCSLPEIIFPPFLSAMISACVGSATFFGWIYKTRMVHHCVIDSLHTPLILNSESYLHLDWWPKQNWRVNLLNYFIHSWMRKRWINAFFKCISKKGNAKSFIQLKM